MKDVILIVLKRAECIKAAKTRSISRDLKLEPFGQIRLCATSLPISPIISRIMPG